MTQGPTWPPEGTRLREPERWAERIDRVHAAGEKPTGSPPPIDPMTDRDGATTPVTPTPDPTDNTTPRMIAAIDKALEELDQARVDLVEMRKVMPDAVRRLTAAQPGFPTAASGGGRTIDVVLEERGGIVHWSCPIRSCDNDPTARGRAVTEGAAQRAFLAHRDEAHASEASTQPERYAMLGPDEAVSDFAALRRTVLRARIESRRLVHSARGGYHLANKWGVTVDTRNVPDPADTEWCTSCTRVPNFSPRRPEGGELCRWCDSALRDINAARAEHDMEPLLTLPLVAAQHYKRHGRGAARHIDKWAAVPTGTTIRRGRKAKR